MIRLSPTVCFSIEAQGTTWDIEMRMLSSQRRMAVSAAVETAESSVERFSAFLDLLVEHLTAVTGKDVVNEDGTPWSLPKDPGERRNVLSMEYPFGVTFCVAVMDRYNDEIEARLGKPRTPSKSGGDGPSDQTPASDET